MIFKTSKTSTLSPTSTPQLAFVSHVPFSCTNHILLTCKNQRSCFVVSPRAVSLSSVRRGASFCPLLEPIVTRNSHVRMIPSAIQTIDSSRAVSTIPQTPALTPNGRPITQNENAKPTAGENKPNPGANPTQQKPKSRFYLPRLASKEDPLWIHKSTTAIFCLSSVLIMGYLPVRQIFFHDAALPPAELLTPLLWAWASTATIQAISGAQMAFQFRKNDTNSRDMFVNNSLMTLINVWVVLKLCAHLPAPFDSDVLSEAITGSLTVLVTGMSLRSIAAAPDLLRTRQKRNAKSSKAADPKAASFEKDGVWSATAVMDYINYIFPIFYPLPFMVGTFLFFTFHDTEWINNQCELYPNIEAIGLYLNVAAAFTIGIISLLVTIRDRKMITKKAESIGISAISIALTAWLIQTLYSLVGIDALQILVPEFLK